MTRALIEKEFIARAIRIHGKRYDYSKVYYENNKTEVCIICKVHGEFWQSPKHHINRKQGCQACYGNSKKTNNQFIEDAILTHGNVYDYSKVEYINNRTKVKITCLKHGDFMQTPVSHINNKSACPHCSKSGYSTR